MLASYLLAIASLTATVLANLAVFTPLGVVVCQPVPIHWSGGTGPYRLSVIPGGQVNAAPLKDFGVLGAQISVYTWLVDIPAGTLITLKLADSSGQISYSVPFTPAAGKSDACLHEALS